LVKIVTDNSADIPTELAWELGISIIPLYVRFGDKVYREGVNINIDGFYCELAQSKQRPQTSTPSPGDFIQLYEHLAEETDEIISLHLSLRYSSTCNVASLAAGYVKEKCKVEVIDSGTASMGLGLIVIAAARAAQRGASMKEIREIISNAIPHTHLFAIITNLDYVMKGSRLFVPGPWVVLAKIGMKFHARIFGEITEGRTRPIGVYLREGDLFNSLERRIAAYNIRDIALLRSTSPVWEQEFVRRAGMLSHNGQIYMARYGCLTGIQAGPCAMGIAFNEGD